MTECERIAGVEYRDMTTEKLNWLLWANLQSNLRRSDIIDRSRDEKHRAMVASQYRDTEQEIRAIRAELRRRS